MTKTLNVKGQGTGLKVVTKPITRKRGANADRAKSVASTRAKYAGKSLSNTPVAEIQAMPIEDLEPLTDKAKLFVKFWAEGNSITKASELAGYGDGASYAHRLKHRADVLALYDAEKRKYEEAAQVTKIEVMNGMKDAIEMAKLMSEPATMIAGWREIGKLCGYYEPKRISVDLSVSGSVTLDKMNKMTDAELLRIIEEAEKLGADQAEMLE